MGTTEALSQFIVNTRYSDISPEALYLAKRFALDWVGVCLAGSAEEPGRIVTAYIREARGAPEARLLGSGVRTSVANAAFANGAMGHFLDFDEAGFVHATTCLAPTLLALGEKHRRSGKDFLIALVLGYETLEQLSSAGHAASLPQRGYHGTALYGSLAAAAVGARLLGLDVPRTRRAFGLAASQAGGLIQNFGTWGKGFHSGHVGWSGVIAATLAAQGFYADEEALEGEHGFFHAILGEGKYDLAKVTEGLGKPWAVVSPGLTIKRYPTCGGNLRALDAALGIVHEHGLKFEDIQSVEVECHPDLFHVMRYRKPTIAFNGKFSLDYNIAAAIVFGTVDIDTFHQRAADDPRMREALEKKVRVVVHPEWTAAQRGQGNPVTITTRDGRSYTKTVAHSKGSPEDPVSQEELRGKFRYCAGRAGLPGRRVERLIELLEHLEEVDDIAEVTRTAVVPGAAGRDVRISK